MTQDRSWKDSAWHLEYIESQYQKWQKSPDSIPADWQHFFQGFDLAQSQTDPVSPNLSHERLLKQSKVGA